MKPAAKLSAEHRQSVSAPRDPHTGILLLLERAIWDAWKDRDPKRLDGLTATSMQFINIFGVHLATKADALQNWSGEGCDINSVELSDAGVTMLTPSVGILTFRARADGVCFGQRPGPIWGSSVYVKQGDTWKWNFGINLPARREGA
jgi:hypothetical protein